MRAFSEILTPIQTDVAELERVLLSLLDSEVPFVKSVAEYVIHNGGKRLRPILTRVCARLSGFQGEASYKMGACIEFIHTASLLHDDVVDNATLRRGQPSANNKWGNPVSVLVGDFFYCRASQILTAQRDWKILKTVTDAITTLTEGEVLEITTNAGRETSREDYFKIIESKTAILFAAACRVGGILGGLTENLETALSQYGLNLGIAFQLADDVLDYTASEAAFGKQSGMDLKEGKLTLPLILALQKTTPEETQLIRSTLSANELNASIFGEIFTIVRKYGGFEATLILARDYIHKAKAALSPFPDCLEKGILLAIADHAVQRDT